MTFTFLTLLMISIVSCRQVLKQIVQLNDLRLSGFSVFLMANSYLSSGLLPSLSTTDLGCLLVGFLTKVTTIDLAQVAFTPHGIVSRSSSDDPSFSPESSLFVQAPFSRSGSGAGNNSTAELHDDDVESIVACFHHILGHLTGERPTELKRLITLPSYRALKDRATKKVFEPSDHVYLGCLPSDYEVADVSDLVSQILGQEPNKIVLRQIMPGHSKHAFIWTNNEKDASRCIKAFNGKFLRGRHLKVPHWTKRILK